MAIKIQNEDAAHPTICFYTVSGYLVSVLTSYRNRGAEGVLVHKWLLTTIQAGYAVFFAFALAEACARLVLGLIAACFGKHQHAYIRDITWYGAVFCLDTAVRTVVAFVKNFLFERLEYEDFLLVRIGAIERRLQHLDDEMGQAVLDLQNKFVKPSGLIVAQKKEEPPCVSAPEEMAAEDDGFDEDAYKKMLQKDPATASAHFDALLNQFTTDKLNDKEWIKTSLARLQMIYAANPSAPFKGERRLNNIIAIFSKPA